MKLMTFTVPCYNSAGYMRKCIDSLLPAGEDTEIIIVNDGSSDDTGKIADEYAALYPERIRVIHQENGGHGEGVNQGLRHAEGLYFKVVDSDDWLDRDSLLTLTAKMREMVEAGKLVDLYVCNYVYEHAEDNTTFVMSYRKNFPSEQICSWRDVRSFGPSQYLMMHSVYFRTEILRASELVLPKHTFYVDNLFMFKPLPLVRSIYYMPLDLYRYFIGRADQSITLENGAKRVDQQILVTKLMADCFDLKELGKTEKRLQRYLLHELSMMILICSVFTYSNDTPERHRAFLELWQYIRRRDPGLYRRLRWRSNAIFATMRHRPMRRITVFGYRFFKSIFKFG